MNPTSDPIGSNTEPIGTYRNLTNPIVSCRIRSESGLRNPIKSDGHIFCRIPSDSIGFRRDVRRNPTKKCVRRIRSDSVTRIPIGFRRMVGSDQILSGPTSDSSTWGPMKNSNISARCLVKRAEIFIRDRGLHNFFIKETRANN